MQKLTFKKYQLIENSMLVASTTRLFVHAQHGIILIITRCLTCRHLNTNTQVSNCCIAFIALTKKQSNINTFFIKLLV